MHDDDKRTADLGTIEDDQAREPLRAGPVDERTDDRADDRVTDDRATDDRVADDRVADDRVDDVVDERAGEHDRVADHAADDDRVDDLVGDQRHDEHPEPAADATTPASPEPDTLDDEPLVPDDAAVDYKTRWEAIQVGFVDDPRSAVTDADALVGDVLQNLAATFDAQHKELEGQWSDGEPSTEDLRSALRRYRDFFERLLRL